jgi:hypothetical protein
MRRISKAWRFAAPALLGLALAANASAQTFNSINATVVNGQLRVTWQESGVQRETDYKLYAVATASYKCANGAQTDAVTRQVYGGAMLSPTNGVVNGTANINPPAATRTCPDGQKMQLVSITYKNVEIRDVTANKVINSTAAYNGSGNNTNPGGTNVPGNREWEKHTARFEYLFANVLGNADLRVRWKEYNVTRASDYHVRALATVNYSCGGSSAIDTVTKEVYGAATGSPDGNGRVDHTVDLVLPPADRTCPDGKPMRVLNISYSAVRVDDVTDNRFYQINGPYTKSWAASGFFKGSGKAWEATTPRFEYLTGAVSGSSLVVTFKEYNVMHGADIKAYAVARAVYGCASGATTTVEKEVYGGAMVQPNSSHQANGTATIAAPAATGTCPDGGAWQLRSITYSKVMVRDVSTNTSLGVNQTYTKTF